MNMIIWCIRRSRIKWCLNDLQGEVAERFKAPVLFPIFLASQAILENRNHAYGGEVAEGFKAAVLKTAIQEMVS